MDNLAKTIGTFFAFLGLLAIWVLITTLPVQLLWNGIVTDLFPAPKLGFWQTFGLLVLVNLVFNRSNNSKSKSDGK